MSSAGSIQLKAALVGDFAAEVRKASDRVHRSAQRALFDYADTELSKLRQDFAQSGLARANELLKTWRERRYLNGGTDPAALVYSAMPIVQAAFEQGATIRSAHGLFLLVPNPDAWGNQRIRHRPRGGSAQSTLAAGEARFGKLAFVYRPGKISLLIADARESAAHPGNFKTPSATARRTGRGLVSLIVFFLLPQTRLKHRLHGDVIRARAHREMQGEIERRFVRYFDADDDSGPKLLT